MRSHPCSALSSAIPIVNVHWRRLAFHAHLAALDSANSRAMICWHSSRPRTTASASSASAPIACGHVGLLATHYARPVHQRMSVLLGDQDRFRCVTDKRWTRPTSSPVCATRHRCCLSCGYRSSPCPSRASRWQLMNLCSSSSPPRTATRRRQQPDVFRPGRDEPPALVRVRTTLPPRRSLARAEAEIMLATLARRWPDLTLAQIDCCAGTARPVPGPRRARRKRAPA
jgi:hypothetical protein